MSIAIETLSASSCHPIALHSQDYKTEVYKQLVTKALPRPGVLELMDAAIATPGLAVGERQLLAISLPSCCRPALQPHGNPTALSLRRHLLCVDSWRL